jgi:Tol biopolymer transport system component
LPQLCCGVYFKKRKGMKKLISCWVILALLSTITVSFKNASYVLPHVSTLATDTLLYPAEKHFSNMQQLTFGGDNAEAYFSYDGKYLIFQRTQAAEGLRCDQMFIGKVPSRSDEKFEYKMISSGKGRTTCGFFMKDDKHIIYASTHLGSPDCPPNPDRAAGYVWPLYKTFDIFSAKPDGTDLKRLTNAVSGSTSSTSRPGSTPGTSSG